MACVYCRNCYNSDQESHNDDVYISIGKCDLYYDFAIESGGTERVPRIVFRQYCEPYGRMNIRGRYYPKYCPECGEKIKEENEDE